MEKTYTGVCACPGKVTGMTTESLEENGILILDTLKPSEFLNPAKTKGFVMRQGGMLSHGAIVAREFNIPCIVATKIPPVKKGLKAELDASEGKVKIND